MKALSGYKTNIGMILLGIMGLLRTMAIMDIPNEAFIIVGSLTGVALRQGIKKRA